MICIKEHSVKVNGHWFDFELEDGHLLHESEWNGEYYETGEGTTKSRYKPIYIEDSEGFYIVGFEKMI